MTKEILNGAWKMTCVQTGETYETTVPSTVMSVLYDNKVIEDPYYRDNEKKTFPIFEDDYEFSTEFSINGENMRHDEIDLVFYGLDTVADIYVNNVMIASTDDMHRTYRFSVREFVNMGVNRLHIYFHSPLKVINEYVPAENKENYFASNGVMLGSQYIRKSHSMFGWDWGPQLPDMGIFRNIELQCYSKARLVDLYVSQTHIDGRVFVKVDPIVKIYDNIPIDVKVYFGDQEPQSTVIRMLEPGRNLTKKGENTIELQVKEPKLWWPNGLGEQNLYDLKITIGKSGKVFDEREMKIGLRTIEMSRDYDDFGQDFAFIVNGRKIFAMGANYIPEDCFYTKITKKRQEYLVKSAAAANFNMFRVWGGGYYPSDDFYDLCDKYGLLVWQDLMFACNIYEHTKSFEENIIAETKDNVRRLRHHACLALWCGNNEVETAWVNWGGFKDQSPYLKADYVKIFEYILPKAMKQVDTTTFYWPSSPSSGGCFDNPEDETRGDTHYWEVWHGQKPYTEYGKHYFRFLSEFGFQSFPGRKTVESFTLPEDRNIFSRVMENHQKNDSANGKILYYISENFLNPKDFNSMLFVSQIMQAIVMKYGVEHLRKNRERCNGALYWQFNDNWPVASWSSVDYKGRWKVLHYMAKRFYAPVHGMLTVELDDYDKPSTFAHTSVVNDGLLPVGVKITQALKRFDGKQLISFDDSCHPLAGKSVVLRHHDYSSQLEKVGAENVYLEAEYKFSDGTIQTEYEVFAPYKHLELAKPEINVTVTEDENCFYIDLSTDTFTPFLFMDLYSGDCIFDDNAFTLTADKPKTVFVYKSSISGRSYASADEFKEDLDINYLQKSYMIEEIAPREIIKEVVKEKIVTVVKTVKADEEVASEKLNGAEDNNLSNDSINSEEMFTVSETTESEDNVSDSPDYFPTGHIPAPPKAEDEYSRAIERAKARRKAESDRIKAKLNGEEIPEENDLTENDLTENIQEEPTPEDIKEAAKKAVREALNKEAEDNSGEISLENIEAKPKKKTFADQFKDKISLEEPKKINFINHEDEKPVSFNKLEQAKNMDESLFDEDNNFKANDLEDYEENDYSKENDLEESDSEDNYTKDSYAEELYSEDSYVDDAYTEDSYTEDSYAEESYTDEYADNYQADYTDYDEYTDGSYQMELDILEMDNGDLVGDGSEKKKKPSKSSAKKKNNKLHVAKDPKKVKEAMKEFENMTNTGILGLLTGKGKKKMSAKELDELLPYDDVPSLAEVEKARMMYDIYEEPMTDSSNNSSKTNLKNSAKNSPKENVIPANSFADEGASDLTTVIPRIPDEAENTAATAAPVSNKVSARTANTTVPAGPIETMSVEEDLRYLSETKPVIRTVTRTGTSSEPSIPSMQKIIQGLDAAAEQKVFAETGVLPQLRKQGMYYQDDVYYEDGIYQDGYLPADFVEEPYEEPYDQPYAEPAPVNSAQPVKKAAEDDIYKNAIKRLKKGKNN